MQRVPLPIPQPLPLAYASRRRASSTLAAATLLGSSLLSLGVQVLAMVLGATVCMLDVGLGLGVGRLGGWLLLDLGLLLLLGLLGRGSHGWLT